MDCLDDTASQCDRTDKCVMFPFWKGLQKTINDYVDGVTLFDLIKDKNPEDEDSFCI